MKEVRSSFVSKITAVITGLVFLNMGFFLNEVRLLKLDVSNTKMVENIVKMISTTGFEEEKDASEGGESGGEQVIDLHLVHQSQLIVNEFHPLRKRAGTHTDQFVSTSHPEIATPPPKRA